LAVLQQHATGLSNMDNTFIHRGNADDNLIYSDYHKIMIPTNGK